MKNALKSFKSAKDISKIAKEKGVSLIYANLQLKKGMKVESEHSKDKDLQKRIALQHLDENIDYYKKLAKMESTFKKGGDVGQNIVCVNCGWHWNTNDSANYDKYVCHKCGFDNTTFYSSDIMAKGGEIDADNPTIKNEVIHKSGKVGGLLVGKRHSEGGIKAINKSSNTPLEMEGGEVVITRNAVTDEKKREFEGEMLTNREILSRINESGGGVSFAKGGETDDYDCGCDKMADGGDTDSKIYKGYEIGGDGTYRKPNIKNFGIKHHDLKPSEAFAKMYGHKYKDGGQVGSIVLIDKKVPSLQDYKNTIKDANMHTIKSAYKNFLKNTYNIVFQDLPNTIQMALYLGNQKLVDKYINS